MNRYDIYIIYQREDIEITRKCAQILRAQGYSCFVDFDSLMNSSFEEQVFEAINGSKCIILIYSKNTESSQYVRREVEFAMEHGIKIIPLLLSDIDSASWYFGKLIDPIFGPIEVREKRLIQYVKANIGGPDNGNESSVSYCPCPSIPRDSYPTKTFNNHRWIIFVAFFVNAIIIIPLIHFTSCPPSSCPPSKSEDIEYSIPIKLDSIDIDTVHFQHSKIDIEKNFGGYIKEESRYSRIILDSIYRWEMEGVVVVDAQRKKDSLSEIAYYNPVSPGFGNIHKKDTLNDKTTNNSSDSNIAFKGNTPQNNEQRLPPPSFAGNHSENNNLYDYLPAIFAVSILLVLCWAFFLWRRRSKRENIKITCNKSAIVHLDGETIMDIEAHQVHKIHLSKGKYIVDFELKSDKTKHYSISINVKNTREDQIIEGTFDLLLKEKNTIKVFIAGSTRLVAERDALRSVIGQMYNKYKEDNLIVEAYSFDDFPREYTEGGHQKLYDEFIKNEADWVVFITDGTIGDKTIWELNNAIDAHKSNKRPKILMYSKPELENSLSKMDSFRKLLNEENQYWIDYTSPNEIKSTFREHLQWDLYNLMKNQYAA